MNNFFQLIRKMSSSSVLEKISDVNIENKGRYKYILVKVTDQNDSSNISKYVVRGGRAFEFHGKNNSNNNNSKDYLIM